MNTKQVGDVSEAAVLAELIQRGYSVSVPFGDNDAYDLVVDIEDELHQIQVKTGWIEDSCLRFKTASKTTVDGASHLKDYTADEVDAFAVRCQDTEALYWVPIDSAGRKNTYLRIEPPEIDHPNVSLAEDFTFDAVLSDPGAGSSVGS
jgi:hypothetical protein